MDLLNLPTKGIPRTEFKKSSKSLLLPGTSLASVESLTMPLEVVISADIRCPECQRRVADIMSRMSETDSVSVDVLEKKVTLTCRYPGVKVQSRQIAAANKKPSGKIALFKRILRSSST